jgi:hypothetical protein
VKKLAIAVALCGSLIWSPAQAATFVGVLWPFLGPLAAPGLVEFVSELKMMPDVQVSTYTHESWPSLADDIASQPPGTHTVIIGYSLGANSSVRVANQVSHVDLIVALQPSMLTSTPALTGSVGRMVEFYNPNPLMTFGGMGSQKLVGENIEYIANNDTHLRAPFNPEFRDLVKDEIAKFAADDRPEAAQAEIIKPLKLAQLPRSADFRPADERLTHRRDFAAKDRHQIAQTEMPKARDAAPPEHFVEKSNLDSTSVFVQRQLTIENLKDYVERTYGGSPSSRI